MAVLSAAPNILVLFGASGDLAARYILPSLAQLHASGELPQEFQVLGLARDDWTTEHFQAHIRKKLGEHAHTVPLLSREALAGKAAYRRTDVTSSVEVARALSAATSPFVAYLALPPFLFEPAITALCQTGVPPGSRIVVEKPFGEDQASARTLNHLLHRCFPEDSVFRIDHFLALETVQNILGLRFANRLFEPVWNALHVERVDIVWDETLTMEGRASYDRVGALRDMLQNHLLQILSLVAMEAPPTLNEADLRGRKFDLLRAVRTPEKGSLGTTTVRGRYTAGSIGNRPVPDYVQEPGVDGMRETETFARITLHIDNWRWAGVPFVLRSGKALGQDRQEILVTFRGVPHIAFGKGAAPEANYMRILLEENRMALGVNTTVPGKDVALTQIALSGNLAAARHSPYGRLLLEVLAGSPALFIRDDEAEESWRIVDPILAGWAEGLSPLLSYAAGSYGPDKEPPRALPPA